MLRPRALQLERSCAGVASARRLLAQRDPCASIPLATASGLLRRNCRRTDEPWLYKTRGPNWAIVRESRGNTKHTTRRAQHASRGSCLLAQRARHATPLGAIGDSVHTVNTGNMIHSSGTYLVLEENISSSPSSNINSLKKKLFYSSR